MGGFKLVVNGVAYDKDRSFLILYLEEALVPGKDLRIEIAFLGEDHLLSKKNPYSQMKPPYYQIKPPYYQTNPYYQLKPFIIK